MTDNKAETTPISPELQAKIDSFLEKVRGKITESGLNFTPLDDGSEYKGTYSTSYTSNKDKRLLNYDGLKYFTITLRDSNNASTKPIKLGISCNDEEVSSVQQALNQML